MKMQIVSGDIGGTKTRLALVEVTGQRVVLLKQARYISRDYANFEQVLQQFLEQVDARVVLALGIAGPIKGRRVETTNLPWVIDADELVQRFALAGCYLLNDLEAIAWGIPALNQEDVCVLQAGDENAQGNRAVIAAGTGLGQAGLFWDGQRHHPYATEGGHASFSPGCEQEFALQQFLQQRYSHVSWERVVSGMGLPLLHIFLSEYHQQAVPKWLVEGLQQGDAGAVIAEAALQHQEPMCVETLRWFLRLYGAEAGNLALKTMSRGGIYIAGGIAPKLLAQIQEGGFLQALLGKGRMRPLLEAMPIKVILNADVSLYGPALYTVNQEKEL